MTLELKKKTIKTRQQIYTNENKIKRRDKEEYLYQVRCKITLKP